MCRGKKKYRSTNTSDDHAALSQIVAIYDQGEDRCDRWWVKATTGELFSVWPNTRYDHALVIELGDGEIGGGLVEFNSLPDDIQKILLLEIARPMGTTFKVRLARTGEPMYEYPGELHQVRLDYQLGEDYIVVNAWDGRRVVGSLGFTLDEDSIQVWDTSIAMAYRGRGVFRALATWLDENYGDLPVWTDDKREPGMWENERLRQWFCARNQRLGHPGLYPF